MIYVISSTHCVTVVTCGTRVPQFGQNEAPGSITALQLGHLFTSWVWETTLRYRSLERNSQVDTPNTTNARRMMISNTTSGETDASVTIKSAASSFICSFLLFRLPTNCVQGPYSAYQRDCVSTYAQASCKEVPIVRQSGKKYPFAYMHWALTSAG